MNGILTRSGLESSEVQPASAKTIKVDSEGDIWSVAFLVDGKHVVCGGKAETIRRWRVEDGMEAGTPMVAGSWVCSIAVSRDGRWIVSGTRVGSVQVWSAESGKKVSEFEGHTCWVQAVDVSPDSTKIASGSLDMTACVWSLSTGQRLLGPWKHDLAVFAVKFSPDGRFIATVTPNIFRIYDSHDGNLVVKVPIKVTYSFNHSLAWSSNSKHLFAVSPGKIICLDASTGATLSQWYTHDGGGDSEYHRIALANDDAFIAVSSNSSLSFWDATTHKQIGSVIKHTANVTCMVISANHDIVIGGGNEITLGRLCNILPSSYCETVVYLNQGLDLLLNEQRRNQHKEDSLHSLRTKHERPGSLIYCPASHALTCLIH